MEQELTSPGDEECPIIVNVYSLVDNPQIKNEPGTQTVKDETGKPMIPSAFLKEFQPFGEKTVTSPIPNFSQTNQGNITTDSFSFRPRTPIIISPRLRLDTPSLPRQPYPPRGVLPTSPPPHLLIRAAQQNTTNYLNTNQTPGYTQHHKYEHSPHPIQQNTSQRPPLAPHQLLSFLQQSKSLPAPPQVVTQQSSNQTPGYIQQHGYERSPHPTQRNTSQPTTQRRPPLAPHQLLSSPPQVVTQTTSDRSLPLYEVTKINQLLSCENVSTFTADHEHTRSHSHPSAIPVGRQDNPGARQHTRTVPLAPHEILQSIPAPTSSHAPNEPTESSRDEHIKKQIIDYLNSSKSLGDSALKISKEIDQPRKLVQEILNRQVKRSTVFIASSTQPCTYSTSYNKPNSGSPYTLQKRPLPSSILDSNNSKRIDTSAKNFNMDPVSLLAHICSRDRIHLDYRMVFSSHKAGKADMAMEVRVGSKVYVARGSNKKNTKKDVSDLALKDLLVMGKYLG